MKSIFIILIILQTYIGSALAETKTTKLYDKKGSFTSKIVENGRNFSIYDRQGKRVAFGETTKNGVVIYDTKGSLILRGQENGIIQPK